MAFATACKKCVNAGYKSALRVNWLDRFVADASIKGCQAWACFFGQTFAAFCCRKLSAGKYLFICYFLM